MVAAVHGRSCNDDAWYELTLRGRTIGRADEGWQPKRRSSAQQNQAHGEQAKTTPGEAPRKKNENKETRDTTRPGKLGEAPEAREKSGSL